MSFRSLTRPLHAYYPHTRHLYECLVSFFVFCKFGFGVIGREGEQSAPTRDCDSSTFLESMMQAHRPYTPPPRNIVRCLRGCVSANVHHLDSINAFVQRKGKGITDNHGRSQPSEVLLHQISQTATRSVRLWSSVGLSPRRGGLSLLLLAEVGVRWLRVLGGRIRRLWQLGKRVRRLGLGEGKKEAQKEVPGL